MDNSSIQFLTRREVAARNNRCLASLYRDIDAGVLTRPVSLGLRAVGWPEHEIAAIARARIAGASQAELRELVNRLHAEREAGAASLLSSEGKA